MSIPLARTVLSEPERLAIEEAFQKEFRPRLRPQEQFLIQGGLDKDRLFIRMHLATQDRTEVLTMECGAEVNPKQADEMVLKRATLVEFLYSMLDEFLREDRWPPPHNRWKEYTYERETVFYRGRLINEKLESAADKLLREAGNDDLVEGDDVLS